MFQPIRFPPHSTLTVSKQIRFLHFQSLTVWMSTLRLFRLSSTKLLITLLKRREYLTALSDSMNYLLNVGSGYFTLKSPFPCGSPMATAQGHSPGLDSVPPTILNNLARERSIYKGYEEYDELHQDKKENRINSSSLQISRVQNG